MGKVLDDIRFQVQQEQKKLFTLLIDPDDLLDDNHAIDMAKKAEACGVDMLFFGGSLVSSSNAEHFLKLIQGTTDIPVILFPASPAHLVSGARAALFLSLISGRNPEYLIGHHVTAAPMLKNLGIEPVPTGYLLIGDTISTTAQYISHTLPIPSAKPDIAVATAMAGEMLGMQLIYMDAGSGAEKPVSEAMIRQVKAAINVPLIVGGGIRTAQAVQSGFDAGADIVVVGNAAFENEDLLQEISHIKKSAEIR